MTPLLQLCIALVVLVRAATIGPAQAPPTPIYFYITSDPALMQHAFSPISRARVKQFSKDRVLAQYFTFLRRTVGSEWFKYAHHAFVHGPFDSEAAAKADYDRELRGGAGQPLRPAELSGFRYVDASVLVAVVSDRPRSQTPSVAPRPWEAALSGSPVAYYAPNEYSWTASPASSAAPATAAELHASAALIWLDQGVNLAPGTSGVRALQDVARQALSHDLDVLVALPSDSSAAATAAIATLEGDFTAKGRRLDLIAADTATITSAMSRRLREFLAVPAIPLRINEVMANNKAAVKGQAGDFPDWVEVVNTGTVAIDLDGMFVSDNNGARSMRRITGADPTKTLVPPGGHVVLWLDAQTTLGSNHVSLRLSSQGDRFTLTDIDGVSVIDRIEFGPQAADKTYARVPDGGDAWRSDRPPTPGATNR